MLPRRIWTIYVKGSRHEEKGTLKIWGCLGPLPSIGVWRSGGATPGRARSNALAKKLLPWLAPWLIAPWLTEISINSINIVHKN